ncbi:Alpha/Beta hydrolase protein [Morchella snyderi]|nr:Alpha/Beta hydrolase protein [Morchella snyderi]
MMVLFQNKIIYMPGVPLGAKRETLQDYKHLLKGIQWHEHHKHIATSDGKRLSSVTATTGSQAGKKHILILYFQGNASSTPPRLPYLSAVLSALAKESAGAVYTLLVPSYRGYWTSTGAPSQAGIQRDLSAVFKHLERDPRYAGAEEVVLWGQSIGCGIALRGWADYLRSSSSSSSSSSSGGVRVAGLILETPFVGVPNMLRVLYPQRWLPYRYLSVFLWSTWDMAAACAEVVEKKGGGAGGVQVLVVSAGMDEVVPAGETAAVEELMRGMVGGERVKSVVVQGALHVECAVRPQGREEIVRFIEGLSVRRE